MIKLDNLAFDASGQNPIRVWPSAMSDLVALTQRAEQVEHKKTYIRFLVRTLQIFDEEIVERYQQKGVADMQLSARIKDWVRVDQIPQITDLLAQVLANSHIFEQKTVKGTLKVLATLIDWNELQHFQGCDAKIRECLRVKYLRAGAFQCLVAIVGKGMPEV